MAQDLPIYYGRCEGGPFSAKDMAHATLTFRVAIDAITRKAHPGMQASSNPDIKFGEYRFDESAKIWAWHAPSETPNPVDN